MSHRFPTSRRPSMESLEVRCNPAAIVPIAESLIELGPVEAPLQISSLTSVAIDPSTSPNAYEGSRLLYTDVFVPSQSVGGGLESTIDDLARDVAGATANRSTAGDTKSGYLDLIVRGPGGNGHVKVLGGGENDVLTGGEADDQSAAGGISKLGSARLVLQGNGGYVGALPGIVDLVVDPRNRDASDYGSNYKYIEDPSRSAIGREGNDLLLGGDARTAGNFTLSFQGESTSSHPGLESIIDDLARDVARAVANGHIKSFSAVDGEVNMSGYIKVKKLNSGDV